MSVPDEDRTYWISLYRNVRFYYLFRCGSQRMIIVIRENKYPIFAEFQKKKFSIEESLQ